MRQSKFVNYIDPDGVNVNMSDKARHNLRERQNEITDLFRNFVNVCNSNNIPYIVIGGTLIGTLRHRGWIPWDDDIDVGMFEEDIHKLKDLNVFKLKKHKSLIYYDLYKIISPTNPKVFIDIFLLKEVRPNMYSIGKTKGSVHINDILPYKVGMFSNIPVSIPNNPVIANKKISFNSSTQPDINKLPPYIMRKPHHDNLFLKVFNPVYDFIRR